MRVWKFWWFKYGIDPPVINGDQMPLHFNESAGSKTLSLVDSDFTVVKENHMVSRKRSTVFTQVASDPSLKLPTDFCFKGAAPSSSEYLLLTLKNEGHYLRPRDNWYI